MNSFPEISKMTLGTVQLGLNYGIANNEGKPDEEKAFRILESAFSGGINCIDTAADYGNSEYVIGKYISASGIKRQEIIIVTKFKLGKCDGSGVESEMMKSFERSLKNLNTGYIDILLMHDAKEFMGRENEILKVYGRLLSEGVLKTAGASCYDFYEIEPMLSTDIFSAFQVPVNLLDMRITHTRAAGMLRNSIIFARSVFLQGLFFLDPSKLKGNLKEAGKYITAISDIAASMNISVSQLAVRYVKSLSYVDSLVIGADNPLQVTENAGLVEEPVLSSGQIEEIEKKLEGAPDWLFKPFLWDKQKE
jgi:aryl-alcohol dehydrogenase-like predicted oxidoreductase